MATVAVRHEGSVTAPATLELSDRSVILRRAAVADLAAIVDLLTDDELGAATEPPPAMG